MDIWQASGGDEGAWRDGAARAAGHLAAGRLVVVPTETVYGLAADATDARAVARIYEAKGRPRFNPLIAHVCDMAMAEREGVFDADARSLADRFWPGPLTLVVPRADGGTVCDLATAGLDTVALRMPASPTAAAIIAALGRPVAAPSANRSGRVSATTAEHATDELGDRVAMIVDAGPCPIGVESTIVACTDGTPVLLRPGGAPRADIEAVLGRALAAPAAQPDAPRAPGMLSSHYAPRADVRLNAHRLHPGEALLAFGAAPIPGRDTAVATLNLSTSGDLVEAAANLFGHLRALDASGTGAIAVMPVPEHGLGEAINDRLRRAAAPRS